MSEQRPGLTVNQGRALRHDLARLSERLVTLARYDVDPSPIPVAVAQVERHPGSDQAFFALDGGRALIVVMPSRLDGSPDLLAARAFIAGPDAPFLYRAGTWHAPLFALERPACFLMAMSETGTSEDCETRVVSPALLVR